MSWKGFWQAATCLSPFEMPAIEYTEDGILQHGPEKEFKRIPFNLNTDLQHPFSGFQPPACPEIQIFVVWSFLGHAFSIRSPLRFRRQSESGS